MPTDDEAALDSDALPFCEQDIADLDARFAALDSGATESIPLAEAQRQLRHHLDQQLRVRQAIKRGVADSEADRVVSTEELRREFGLPGPGGAE